MVTKEQLHGGFAVLQAVCEAIRELREVSNTKLYSHLCCSMGLDTYEKIIKTLKNAEVIKQKGDLLIWNVEEK